MRGINIFKQKNIGNTWGYASQVASQATIFITVLNLFMLAATFFQTTLSVWLLDKGIVLPFWLFMTFLIALLAVMAVVLYKYAVPSFFSAFNDQFYKHDNLLRKDIDAIKTKLGIKDEDSDNSGD